MIKPPVQQTTAPLKISPTKPNKTKLNKRCKSVTYSSKDVANLTEPSQHIDRYYDYEFFCLKIKLCSLIKLIISKFNSTRPRRTNSGIKIENEEKTSSNSFRKSQIMNSYLPEKLQVHIKVS